MRRLLSGVCSFVVLAAAACDSGPSGPGTLDAVVTSQTPVGAVVLEVTGPGVRGFEEQGSTRAIGGTLSETDGRHRVVLVVPDGAQPRFGIRVDDLGAEPPVVTVAGAVGVDDIAMLTTGIGVRIER